MYCLSDSFYPSLTPGLRLFSTGNTYVNEPLFEREDAQARGLNINEDLNGKDENQSFSYFFR